MGDLAGPGMAVFSLWVTGRTARPFAEVRQLGQEAVFPSFWVVPRHPQVKDLHLVSQVPVCGSQLGPEMHLTYIPLAQLFSRQVLSSAIPDSLPDFLINPDWHLFRLVGS